MRRSARTALSCSAATFSTRRPEQADPCRLDDRTRLRGMRRPHRAQHLPTRRSPAPILPDLPTGEDSRTQNRRPQRPPRRLVCPVRHTTRTQRTEDRTTPRLLRRLPRPPVPNTPISPARRGPAHRPLRRSSRPGRRPGDIPRPSMRPMRCADRPQRPAEGGGPASTATPVMAARFTHANVGPVRSSASGSPRSSANQPTEPSEKSWNDCSIWPISAAGASKR